MATDQYSGKTPSSGSGKDPRASVAYKGLPPAAPPKVVSGPRPGAPEPGSGMRTAIMVGGILLVLIVVANVIYATLNGQKATEERITVERTVELDEAVKVQVGKLEQQLRTLENTVRQQDMRIQELQVNVTSFSNAVNDMGRKAMSAGR